MREAKLSDEVSGEIYPDLFSGGSSGYSIRVNVSHPLVRKRFTIAHEVAHFLRHRDRISNSLIDDRMYRSRLGTTVESEANQLAADLLMPRRLVGQFRNSGITTPRDLANKFNAKTKRAGAFYETYREAWHLLKEPQPTETPEQKSKMQPTKILRAPNLPLSVQRVSLSAYNLTS